MVQAFKKALSLKGPRYRLVAESLSARANTEDVSCPILFAHALWCSMRKGLFGTNTTFFCSSMCTAQRSAIYIEESHFKVIKL